MTESERNTAWSAPEQCVWDISGDSERALRAIVHKEVTHGVRHYLASAEIEATAYIDGNTMGDQIMLHISADEPWESGRRITLHSLLSDFMSKYADEAGPYIERLKADLAELEDFHRRWKQ